MKREYIKYAVCGCAGAILLAFAPELSADGAQLAQEGAKQSGANGGLIATIGAFLHFMRSHTVSNIMQWVNFFILFFLIFKFVVPLVERALEEGVSDIETRLSAQEQEKKKLLQKAQDLKASLAGIEEERTKRLEEAKDQAIRIKEEILTDARESEMRIFELVDQSAAAHYYERVNQIKNQFFAKVSDHAQKDLESSKNEKSMKSFGINLIGKSEVKG